MSNLWMIPINEITFLAIMILISILAYLLYSQWFTLNVFSVGTQYRMTTSGLRKSKFEEEEKKSKKSKKKKSKVKDNKKPNVSEEKFNMNAARYGIPVSYRQVQHKRNNEMLLMAILFLIGAIMFLFISDFFPKISTVIFIISTTVPIYRLFKWDIMFFVLSFSWKRDVVEDLTNLVSFYIYSSERTGLVGAIEDSINDMNALKVDLQMFLADTMSFSQDIALDRFAERMRIKEVDTFINYIKSTAVMEKSQSQFVMSNLNETLLNKVSENNTSSSKTKFKITLFVIVLSFVGVILIYSAPQIIEIMSSDLSSIGNLGGLTGGLGGATGK